MIRQLLNILSLVLISLILSSCKKELKEPHMIDPIYLDLVKEYGALQSKVASQEKSLEVSLKEYSESQPRSLDRKIKAREVEKARQNIQKLTQMSEYYRIKADLRRAYGRREYLLAFQKNEAWPSKEDIEAYFKAKELHQAPKKWSVRVPGSPYYDEKKFGKADDKGGQDSQATH